VTVIATVTVDQMEQAAHAMADPDIAMPAPARTGGGSSLPMRDLIRMAGNGIHYLAVFDGHSERPIYLGRSTRIATADQRLICHAADRRCGTSSASSMSSTERLVDERGRPRRANRVA
jgi:hypothetical protein